MFDSLLYIVAFFVCSLPQMVWWIANGRSGGEFVISSGAAGAIKMGNQVLGA
jgi:hypothetical protein